MEDEMARDLFTNQAQTTVSSGGTTAPAAGTTESWTVASSSSFPAASNAAIPVTQFYVADPALPSESILVTNVSGTTWSVTRGVDGTTPVAHTAGFTVKNIVTATWLQALDDKVKYNTLNVKDYGAKGDNFTNDQPAIQAALDDAWKMGGAQVIIPRGIYRIMSAAVSSSPLKIRSNVRLTLLTGAEIHRYANPSAASLCWSGDWTQGMAGFNGHRNMVIEGGLWDMRNSSSTVSLASDDFNRAATTAAHTLGTMTSGQAWIDETSRDDGASTAGNLGITASAAYNPAASTGIATVGVWPDGTYSVVVSTTNTTGQTGLVFRLENATNYWQLTRDGSSGNARLSYWVNGTETVVTPTNTRAVAAGATLTVTCFGNRIIAGVITTGTYAMSHDTTDLAGFTAKRKSGVIITDTTSRLDTFSASASIWADNFNRAASASSLGITSSGYTWTSRSGNLGITASAASAPSAATNISTVDVTSETNPTVTVSTVGTTLNGVVFRYIDNSNYWYYARNAAGNAELAKVVGGSTTIITPGATQAVANGNVLNVNVIGYEINCYVGATLTHSVNNDSANYAGTKAGIIINDTTARLDNFDTPAAWGQSSGACFSFSHNNTVTFRDMTIRDTSQNSHSIDMQGLKDCLVDNVTFIGCVGNQQRGAVQVDAAINDGLPPIDSISTQDLLVRGCTIAQSYSPGTNAYPRGFESHAGKVGTWYGNIRLVDNYFDVSERAIKGYNWNNGVISNNNIISGWGIEYRPVWTGNTTDTTTRGGTQTNASQLISGVTISGNTIDARNSSAAVTDGGAIRVYGETTGHISDVTITGNTILGATQLGIEVQYVDRGTVSGNTVSNTGDRGIYIHNCTDVMTSTNVVYNAANHGIGISSCTGGGLIGNTFDTTTAAGAAHGIVVDTCTDVIVSNNQSVLAGKYGVYVLAGSRIRLLDNYVYGASRNANNANASIKLDTTPNDVTVSGNTTRPVGSGNDATYGFHCSTGTNIRRLNNDFHTGATGDVFVVATGDLGDIVVNKLTADASSYASTTYGLVAGLTAPINVAGTYRFKAMIFVSQATVANTVRFGIGGTTANSGTGAPTSNTAFAYTVQYGTSNSTAGTVHGSSGYLSNTGNSGTLGATATAFPVLIEGVIVATTTGTLQIQQATGVATSAITVKNGSTFTLERIHN
ncbi:MAG: right-handed parallel beta-helix repeat-containing protein [Actinobacteria bacterium]|nr:right-handed parallel beta-helix repeat-containing protein [Actinomycetota bacterium]